MIRYKNIVLVLIFVFFKNEYVSAEIYKYIGKGFGIELSLNRNDTNISIVYTIYNRSEDVLFYKPSCVITNMYNTLVGIELGVICYSFDSEHTLGTLKKLKVNDSVTIKTSADIKNLDTKQMIIAFDCIQLKKLSKRQKKIFLKSLISIPGNKYNIDNFDYNKLYTDLFRLALPTLKIDKNQ